MLLEMASSQLQIQECPGLGRVQLIYSLIKGKSLINADTKCRIIRFAIICFIAEPSNSMLANKEHQYFKPGHALP